MARRRVLITGLGPVTGFGIGIEPLWDAMIDMFFILISLSSPATFGAAG